MSAFQYMISINQVKSLEWGLNAQQAMVFSLVHQLPTWADAVQMDGDTWYHLSKKKIVDELPLLTDKPDTGWRYLKQLVTAGLIETTTIGNRTHVRVTDKGKEWNRTKLEEEADQGRKNLRPSEKTPQDGKTSDGRKNVQGSETLPAEVGNFSEAGSEKSPTDDYYKNHNYQDQNTNSAAAASPAAESTVDDESNLTDPDIVPGWPFSKLLNPPELDAEMGTYIVLPLRADQSPPYHAVTDQDVLNLQDAFRGVQVADELRVMLGWCVANPTQRKTAAGIRRFISSWLTRSKQQGASPFAAQTPNLTGYEKTGLDKRAQREAVRRALRDVNNTDWFDSPVREMRTVQGEVL